MGSSAKRRKEKKKDFQKAKLKVGKARPKAANHTDTNFSAKAIVLNQQSLQIDAPTAANTFLHNVSLLSSRTDSQRRDSLAFLTSQITTLRQNSQLLPITINALFEKACPLILDGSSGIRIQVLKLFQALPSSDVNDHVTKLLPYVRAGLTHLSKEIRVSTVELLSWLVPVAGNEIVSSAGGWLKMLECLSIALGWKLTMSGKDWSSSTGSKMNLSTAGDAKTTPKIMQVLAEFVRVGLLAEESTSLDAEPDTLSYPTAHPLWNTDFFRIPEKANAYGYLDLFNTAGDTDDKNINQMLESRDERLRVFNDRFRATIEVGIESARKDGGELGRIAGSLSKAISTT